MQAALGGLLALRPTASTQGSLDVHSAKPRHRRLIQSCRRAAQNKYSGDSMMSSSLGPHTLYYPQFPKPIPRKSQGGGLWPPGKAQEKSAPNQSSLTCAGCPLRGPSELLNEVNPSRSSTSSLQIPKKAARLKANPGSITHIITSSL